MDVIMRRVKDLKPYEKNAKKHDEKQIANVANSIRRFGWKQPLVIDEKGTVVIGHCRLLAAKKLGMEEVPRIVASDLTEEEIRELRIADNKTNESPWDLELLADDLQGLDFEGFDFDFGIDDDAGEEREITEDDYDAAPPEQPKAKLGDIYQLGRHRLMCGDSTRTEDVAALMDGKRADLLLTDPPYNVALGMGGSFDDARKRHRRTDGLVIMNDHMPEEDFRAFLCSCFRNAKENMKPGASFYIWHADNESYTFRGVQRTLDSLSGKRLYG